MRAFGLLLVLLLLVACDPAGGPAPTPGPSPTPLPSATPLPTPTTAPPAVASLIFADQRGSVVAQSVDGNSLTVRVGLGAAASEDTAVAFALDGYDQPFAKCTVPVAGDGCSAAFRADGWSWDGGKLIGKREAVAFLPGLDKEIARATLAVAPKPVVMVHGLNSDQNSWIQWIRPGGYLEQNGMKGYAVDDQQFGTARMNTGLPAKPFTKTKSIAENAAILADYISAVRANTGADRIDLMSHSLGGLISRYYLQNLMPVVASLGLPDQPVVNQLIMAGTPNGGTPCGRIPAALGLFSPATTQITPEYLTQVFNPTVNDSRGVPVFAIAASATRKQLAIRCTEIPTDRYVSVRSVLRGVAVAPGEVTGTHSDLNNGEETFRRALKSFARSPRDYPIEPGSLTEPEVGNPERVQSTLVQGGTLVAGETVSVTLTIDQARDASFILLAPGSQVSMTIKTVAGKILTEETPKTNPNVTFERFLDDSLPLSLGYGVLGPKAGAWEIGLTARMTPPGGGPFALVATLDTDLQMAADVSPGAATSGQDVMLRATLTAPNPPQKVVMSAVVRNDSLEGDSGTTVALFDDGGHDDGAAGDGVFAGVFRPDRPGGYTVNIAATGADAAGNPFERLSVLGVDVS